MLAGILIGTSCTDDPGCDPGVVNLMEVVFPAPTPPPKGFEEPGLLMVKGYEVGGRTIVVAVALGTLEPGKGTFLEGGLDVVNTVTLFITAKFTEEGELVIALGTAKRGLFTGLARMGVAEVAVLLKMATAPVLLGLGFGGLGTLGILKGCLAVVAKSTGWLCSGPNVGVAVVVAVEGPEPRGSCWPELMMIFPFFSFKLSAVLV